MSFHLAGAGVVITGGGAGIGAAMARRLASGGARVVVADLDEHAATTVATEVGGFAVGGDATTEDGIDRLLQAATDHLGAIDLYCANAGIAPPGGPGTPERIWAKAWEINVMAHVRAAHRLLPGWLDRGRGRFLATVSAAGLLTMLGSAPYSVTKHAALGFAEWLSATYHHRGITVQALCPQGVRTSMLANSEPDAQMIMNASAIEPSRVAECVIDALADDRFLILPHPEVTHYYQARATDTRRWISGMNKLQQKIESSGYPVDVEPA